MTSAFSKIEINQFIQDGYVILRGAFPKILASEGRDYIWQRLEVSSDNPGIGVLTGLFNSADK
jgi:hypothetical protein